MFQTNISSRLFDNHLNKLFAIFYILKIQINTENIIFFYYFLRKIRFLFVKLLCLNLHSTFEVVYNILEVFQAVRLS